MIIARTPVRISFVGGGTDFKDYWVKNGGGVVSTTIDKFVYAIVKRRFDDDICINYTKRERVRSVDEIEHELVRESMKITGVNKGVEITTLADIPSQGSGLGSSSSVTVALLHALYAFKGILVTAEELAQQACKIEIDILGSPIGIQDQYIAAYGGLRHLDFRTDGTVGVEKLALSPNERRKFSSNLCLFYLKKTRKSSSILTEQKANIDAKREILDAMFNMVEPFKNVLNTGDFEKSGRILHNAWIKKKSLTNKISNSDIDTYYQAALDAGAVGGKVTGAGGGGFLLLFCPPSHQANLIIKMNDMGLQELPFNLEPQGSKIVFSQNDRE